MDYRTNIVYLPILMSLALMSSETATFQLPAALVTLTVISWKNRQNRHNSNTKNTLKSLIFTVISLIPRYIAIIGPTFAYLYLRVYYDTLDIPSGLIRPAENPFYEFTGMKRALSYSLVVTVHIGKLFLFDPLGFSHEYGFNCLPAVEKMNDIRLAAPVMLVFAFLGLVGFTLSYRKERLESILMLTVAFSWIMTLFPISGVIKVGTFIADRIIVPSTVVFAVFGGGILTHWLYSVSNNKDGKNDESNNDDSSSTKIRKSSQSLSWWKVILVGAGFWMMGEKVKNRANDWMNHTSLLKSSLKTCPNSAKSNLEMSKLVMKTLNFTHVREYLTKAEKIDPDYCDVHHQWSLILQLELDFARQKREKIQKEKVLEFEDRLTKSVLCPFSMGGAVPRLQSYWANPISIAGSNNKNRSDKQMAIIQRAVQEAVEEEANKKRSKSTITDEL